MIVTPRLSPFFRPLILVFALMTVSSVYGAKTNEDSVVHDPWAFNLTLYMWFPGLDGNFSAGPLSDSVNLSFIDIARKLRSFPMAFNGHLEAHYDRLGFYMDGNYLDLKFEPRFDRGIAKGLSTELGVMDYGVTYRLFGSAASERIAHWDEKPASNILDVYAGGRSIWLGNQLEFRGIGSFSGSKTFTAPIIGGRIVAEFLPKWFLMLDGNVGGFGVDNVKFTGSALGSVGYRTRLFGVPASAEAGYKALKVDVGSGGAVAANMTLNGPFIGLTGYW
jgi:hypothetical protein